MPGAKLERQPAPNDDRQRRGGAGGDEALDKWQDVELVANRKVRRHDPPGKRRRMRFERALDRRAGLGPFRQSERVALLDQEQA
jgi:hypothetical protein